MDEFDQSKGKEKPNRVVNAGALIFEDTDFRLSTFPVFPHVQKIFGYLTATNFSNVYSQIPVAHLTICSSWVPLVSRLLA